MSKPIDPTVFSDLQAEHPSLDSLRDLLREQHRHATSPMRKVMWLGITLVFFAVVLGVENIATTLLVLVPVILFHEAGHLVAMKLCGYTDVSVFFIPLVGAAATGHETRPSPVRRAFVSLMGPAPGILLGFVLMIALDWRSHSLMATGVQMLFFLNLFNLLPIQPLDGGRLLHDLVMSRSAVTAIVFSLGSPLILGLIGLILGDWIFIGLGVVLFAAAMGEVKVILAVRKLRKGGQLFDEGKVEELPDPQLETLIGEARSRFAGLQPKTLAIMVRRMYDRATTPRASVFATLGLVGTTSLVVLAGLIGLGISFFLLSRADPTYRERKVSEWVMLLGDEDPATREEAQSVLEAVVREDDWVLADSAVYTIGEMGPDAAPAVPILVGVLEAEDPGRRSGAATALGGLGPGAAAAAPDLVRVLQDEVLDVRMSAATALGSLGPVAKTHLPAIREARKAEESWLVRDALETTIRILERTPELKD